MSSLLTGMQVLVVAAIWFRRRPRRTRSSVVAMIAEEAGSRALEERRV